MGADSDSLAPPSPRAAIVRWALLGAGPALFAITAFVLGGFEPAGDGLSPQAALLAGVLAWMALWWITEPVPLPITSLLPIVLLPVLGITPDVRTAAAPYADPLVFLFLGGFFIAMAMERSMLHQRIALSVLSLVGSSPRMMVGGVMLATGLVSAWVSNTATAMMMLPIAMTIAAVVREHFPGRDGNFKVCMTLAVAYSASIGGLATPIGTPPNLAMLAYLEAKFGKSIDFASFMLMGVPVVLVMLPLTWLLLTRVLYPVRLPPIPGGKAFIRDRLRALGRPSRAEATVFVVFCLTAGAWILRVPLAAAVPSLKNLLEKRLDDAAIAIAGAIAMFLIPVDRTGTRPVLKWTDSRDIPWGVLLLFGGGLSLASCVGPTGLDRYIGESLRGMQGLDLFWIVLALAAITVFVSEVASNLAVITIFSPIVGAVALGMGIDPLLLLVPLTIGATCAFMMPMGTAPNALAFSTGNITVRQMAWAGFWLNLVSIAVATLAAYTLAPLALRATFDGLPDWALPHADPAAPTQLP